MKSLFTFATAVLLLSAAHLSYAQDNAAGWRCSSLKGQTAAKTTIGSMAEDNYDIKYLKFNLALDNRSTRIAGDVTTTAKVVGHALPTYVFELEADLSVDSVFVNGIPHPVTTYGNIRTVTLPTPLPKNAMFTSRVFYHGIPIAVPGASVNGMNNRSGSWNTRVTYTHSEPFSALEWWPCKQSLRDKIDSMDVWVTVPDSLKAGSNGVLQAVTRIDPTHVRYEWKERYPIDYYLISASVATYTDYSYYVHFPGGTDSMLVQNYIYSNPAFLTSYKKLLDSTGLMINYFSDLFGRYPFWREKYGHCIAPLGGAMEHQTMTTLGVLEGTIIAHELGHQWFGDNVTCASWADIFMNEGLASYSEDIFIDHFRSHAKALYDIRAKQTDVKSVPTGTIYVDDTTTKARIINSRLSYHKGASMLHMLRFVISNDSAFFQIIKNYQKQYRGGNITIMDFKETAKDLLGDVVNEINLDTFFNQWVYLEGYPIYAFNWNQSGSDVYVQLDQVTAVPSSVPFFTLPMELTLHSASGDTTIRVVNNQPGQFYHFTWSKPMTSLIFDSESWLLDSFTVQKNPSLRLPTLNAPAVKIYPNPASEGWTIDNIPANSTLLLTDVSGRMLWQSNTQNTRATIPANSLASGLYLLRITNNDNVMPVYKLIRE